MDWSSRARLAALLLTLALMGLVMAGCDTSPPPNPSDASPARGGAGSAHTGPTSARRPDGHAHAWSHADAGPHAHPAPHADPQVPAPHRSTWTEQAGAACYQQQFARHHGIRARQ